MKQSKGFIAVLMIILLLICSIDKPESNRAEVSTQVFCVDTSIQSEAETSQVENILTIIVIVVIALIIISLISEILNKGGMEDWK